MNRKLSKYFVDNKNGHCRLCLEPDTTDIHMVQCDECDRWFHLACAKLSRLPTEEEQFLCVKCTEDRAKMVPLPSDAPSSTNHNESQSSNAAIMALVEALQSSNAFASRHLIRMTLNELPYFDGKASDWPKFKKAFEETSRTAGFSKLENLSRLERHLKGNAKRSVRFLFLDPENVDLIMTRLEEQFGRSEQVYHELLNEVTRAKGDHDHIPELHDALQDLVTNIMAMEKQAYLHDHRLIEEIAGKLPVDKQISWIEYKRQVERRALPTLEHFTAWMAPIASNIRLLPKKVERKPINLHETSTTRKPPLITAGKKQWRWMPTKKNPAHIATKIVDDDSARFNGPDFLQFDETSWPESKAKPSTNEEAKFVAHHYEPQTIATEDRYSHRDKMIRHQTYLKKFVDSLKSKETFNREITVGDVQQVKNTFYRKAQWEGFAEEMKAVGSKKGIHPGSSINKLLPYLDIQWHLNPPRLL